jgi:dsRNA-specific ribonuclease
VELPAKRRRTAAKTSLYKSDEVWDESDEAIIGALYCHSSSLSVDTLMQDAALKNRKSEAYYSHYNISLKCTTDSAGKKTII